MGRPARTIAATAVLLAAWVAAAAAAHIDAELKRIIQDKSRAEIIPVLMVFPEQADLDDLEVMLDGATPSKRRKSAIAALKRRARKAQADAWEILDDPDLPGELLYADMLYFSNAIAFGGDREVVLAVAEAGDGDDKSADQAILFYDKDIDLINDAVPPAGDGLKSARADTTWNLHYVGVPEVWSDLGVTGAGILVGHLDTGVDLHHPDLRHRIAINPGEITGNGVDDDGNGLVDDIHGWDFGDGDADPSDDASMNAGHGTHTAGTVVGDGSAGVQTGVAPGASLLPVKIFTSAGTSSLGRIWVGQQYCIERGCRIITMSVGIKGDIPSAYLRNDRYNAAAIRAAGVVVFNSAGNEHDVYDPPVELGMTARIPAPWSAQDVPWSSTGGIVTVGATGYQTDEPYALSSQGPAGWDQVDPWHDWPFMPGPGLIKPDVVAPGANIRSTLPLPLLYSGETWSGTSMSTPLVAGVAALMLEKNPTLSPAGVDSLLELTARDLGPAGKDNVHGAGLIDAHAAVSAVLADFLPNLSTVEFLPDPLGNGTLDRGELAEVAFDVRNAGYVQAEGVMGRLSVESNPHVGVIDDTAAFPDINPGSWGANVLDPFQLAVSPLAPDGERFTMRLALTTGDGFERVFDVESYLGLPEYRTHDQGDVYLSVTARGSLGYLTDARQVGQGMGREGAPSALFVGSLWAGGGPGYVCNNDLTASGADPAEWTARRDPTGHVRVQQQDEVEQIFALAFNDSAHAQPRGISVGLTSCAWADPMLANVVKLDYVVSNDGPHHFAGYHAGLFVDWDVIDSLGNVGGTDETRRAAWVGMPGGPVYGMAVVGDAPVANVTVIDNVEYVYPVSHVIDTHKYQFLNGTLHTPSIDEPTDVSSLVSVGPLELDPGEQVRVTFLVGYGDDVASFLAAIEAAGDADGVTSAPRTTPTASPLILAQNAPNPFNPVTEIRFALPRSGPVDLAIYDLAGRRVRTLVAEDLTAGEHAIRWNGRTASGDQAASGMYVYRLITEQGQRSRKMMLVK